MRSGFLCYPADPLHKARETDPPPAGQLIPVCAAFQSLRSSFKPQSHYVDNIYIPVNSEKSCQYDGYLWELQSLGSISAQDVVPELLG